MPRVWHGGGYTVNKYGFTLMQERDVPEIHSQGRMWRHDATGAQLLSFINKDENKVFGVTLRTPPHDSTGLPHILEHSVLCGSDKYPVKEPFVELLKGSLQTFLNAFTYPDKTCYPVASANLQDFYNLIDVYLDAVFHARLTPDVLQQEGWHLDVEQAEQVEQSDPSEQAGHAETGIPKSTAPKITFKGVVYNEMKGVFSSPEAVLERHSLHALFPDTPYGLESGGDPVDIPTLTFSQFLDFYKRYYHPSNARFYFWGNDPEDKRLEIIGQLLDAYQPKDVARRIDPTYSVVPLQKPFTNPRDYRLPFAAGEEDKAMFTMNWVLPPTGETPEAVELTLALEMLDHILLGMPASPLRRALIESGLGEDLTGGGMQDELRQMVFSIGLKGMAEKSALKVRELILDTLRQLAENGIGREHVDAAVNSIEFALRENNTGRFPVGLAIMVRSLTTWLHSDDPTSGAAFAPLHFEEPLANIKRKCVNGRGYFEGLIQQHFLQNPHLATVLMIPDKTLAAKQAEEEEKRISFLVSGLNAAEKEALAKNTERLKVLQATPDSPEDLAKIPHLGVDDLPLSNQEIRQKLLSCGPCPLYYQPQPTSGIAYLAAHLDISAVPDRLLPLLPMLGRAMTEMGNDKLDFASLNMEIAAKTGGMDAQLNLYTRLDDGLPLGGLCLSGKAAPDKVDDLFRLTGDLLSRTRLDDKELFSRMLLEEKSRLEHSLVPEGHMAVSTRLKGALSPTGCLAEQSSGITYLNAIRALAEQAASGWPSVLKQLQELRKILLSRKGLLLSITAEPEQEETLGALAVQLTETLPGASPSPVNRLFGTLPHSEALVTPSMVNYVGKGVNLYQHGYSYHGSAMVILKYLRTGYLWERVRVQGGAYGAFCALDRATGDFTLVSYRDPNIATTLKTFDACAEQLVKRAPGKAELDAAIVGAIGELDAYMLPEARGRAAFARAITGNTPEKRAQLRREILETTADDFKRFGHILAEALPQAYEVALGGSDLETYAKEHGWTVNRVL